jgi:hypothetical protein
MIRARAVRVVPLLAVVLALGGLARAADTKAVVAEIEGHDKAFLAAYENGETKKMKSEIAKAVALGEKNGLGSDAVMADTYVLAGIFDVDGNDDAKAGVRSFVKALKIKPDVTIPKGMATSPVKAAFKQARGEAGLLPKEGAAPAAAGAAAPAGQAAEAAKGEPPSEKADKDKAKEEAAEKARADAQAKQEKQQEQKDKQAREDRERQAKQEQEKQERQEQAKQQEQEKQEQAKQEQARQKELAQKEKADKASKAESDKQGVELKGRVRELEKDKADRDKQLADAKARAQQLEKDKADRDKQLADAKAHAQQLEKDKADRDKQLADAKARIQQLEKDKADRDKQLADGRARTQQLERERTDKDKQLADARAQGSKDREALDKIARDKQIADTQARDAENKRKQEREQRERLFAGPEMPSRLREALTCAVPDEAPLRTDLFVHCVARPNVKARSIIFYYRAGSAHYYSVPMERTAKGWYAAIVPGVRVVGKVMQYYAEALDGRESVVANNGKENSPNILSLRPGSHS